MLITLLVIVGSTLLVGAAGASAQSPPTAATSVEFRPPTLPRDPSRGANIQRTMTLLHTSTPERRNTVRVLFYGQSITVQEWWREVADDLRARFPHADLVIENRAIGGFAVPLLSRPAEHDLFPFQPDLIVFHVYGGQDAYEAFVRDVRSRTTAEMVICGDHLSSNQNDPWHDRHNADWLPKLCQHYGLEFVDIRAGWRQYLADNKLQPRDLLSDDVHLNDLGCRLYAALVKAHLVHNPQVPTNRWAGVAREFTVRPERSPEGAQSMDPALDERPTRPPDQSASATDPDDNAPTLRWTDNMLRLDFTGTRVDAIPAATSDAEAVVTIDGKPPAEIPGLFAITRPTDAVGVGWPAVTRVSFERLPVAEEWTCRITRIHAQARDVEFEVVGSVTGPDGGGRSTGRFVSNSGRVVIERGDWHLEASRRHTRRPVPEGFEFKWTVYPQHIATYHAIVEDASSDSAVTLAQGLPPGRHTVELTAPPGRPVPPIRALRVYAPPLDKATVPEIGLMPHVQLAPEQQKKQDEDRARRRQQREQPRKASP